MDAGNRERTSVSRSNGFLWGEERTAIKLLAVRSQMFWLWQRQTRIGEEDCTPYWFWDGWGFAQNARMRKAHLANEIMGICRPGVLFQMNSFKKCMNKNDTWSEKASSENNIEHTSERKKCLTDMKNAALALSLNFCLPLFNTAVIMAYGLRIQRAGQGTKPARRKDSVANEYLFLALIPSTVSPLKCKFLHKNIHIQEKCIYF